MSDISNYLQSLEDRIDKINTCAMLQEVSDAIKAELESLLQDLADQQASLLQMTIPPVDLTTTILWIKGQIDATIKPMMETIAEMTLVMTKVTSIINKLEGKMTSLKCDFPAPSVTPPIPPTIP